jgi:nicotinate-nucleotide adenylyltransferase
LTVAPSTASAIAIGILGGTFDPIHYGHLRLAQEVAEALSLTEVRFIPSGTPPHRARPQTSAAHRVAMVKLAIEGNPLFQLDEREVKREGLSYTYDTLAAVRREVDAAMPLVLMMGADAFLKFHTWHRWTEIVDLAHIAVATRPGATLEALDNTELAAQFAKRRADARAVRLAPAGSMIEVPITPLAISATALRQRIAAGHSARYLTPAPVFDYIKHNSLFLNNI